MSLFKSALLSSSCAEFSSSSMLFSSTRCSYKRNYGVLIVLWLDANYHFIVQLMDSSPQ
jgi:hypothetical protein